MKQRSTRKFLILTTIILMGFGFHVPIAEAARWFLFNAVPIALAALNSINADTTSDQVITVDTSGTDVAVATAGGTTTISVPSASATARGVVTTGAQTLAGVKTLSSAPILSALTASRAVVTDGSKALASLQYTDANTASTIVSRDGSGNFSAGTITATLSGNASTATALAANPSTCSAGQYVSDIAADGTLTCTAALYPIVAVYTTNAGNAITADAVIVDWEDKVSDDPGTDRVTTGAGAWKFTVGTGEDGDYMMCWRLRTSGQTCAASNLFNWIGLNKNGSNVAWRPYNAFIVTTDRISIDGCYTFAGLVATDYINMDIQSDCGTTGTIMNDASYNQLTIYRIR